MGTFLNYTYEGADFVYGYLATGRPFLPEAYNHTGDAQLTAVVQTVLGDINTMGVMPAPFFFGPLSIIYFVRERSDIGLHPRAYVCNKYSFTPSPDFHKCSYIDLDIKCARSIPENNRVYEMRLMP